MPRIRVTIGNPHASTVARPKASLLIENLPEHVMGSVVDPLSRLRKQRVSPRRTRVASRRRCSMHGKRRFHGVQGGTARWALVNATARNTERPVIDKQRRPLHAVANSYFYSVRPLESSWRASDVRGRAAHHDQPDDRHRMPGAPLRKQRRTWRMDYGRCTQSR